MSSSSTATSTASRHAGAHHAILQATARGEIKNCCCVRALLLELMTAEQKVLAEFVQRGEKMVTTQACCCGQSGQSTRAQKAK
jgi:hypothetical protein